MNYPRIYVYSGTRNTYRDIPPAITSLVTNTPVDRIFLLIEDDTFPYPLPSCVTTINVSNQTYFPKGSINYYNGWTYMVLLRSVYSKLFDSYDRIVSLDIDTYVDADIDKIWQLSIENHYIAAAHEVHKPNYYNCGVMLMNLKKLREDHKDDEIVAALNTKKYPFSEQDCFNELCAGHIYDLPAMYNVSLFTEIVQPEDRKIIHYAAIKDMREQKTYKKYKEMYENEVRQKTNPS